MVILYDRFNLPKEVFEIIFATEQQAIVAKELMKHIMANKGEVSKTDMSMFATALHDGKYECVMEIGQFKGKKVKLSYNKRQFYDRILTPMKAMGMIDYDLFRKTYKFSNNFSKDLLEIGLLWKNELRRMGAQL